MTLAGVSEQIRQGAITSRALVERCLATADGPQAELNAFITLMRHSALQDADRLDGELSRGHWRGPLHGVPVAIKDNIDVAGMRCTAGSAVFDERIPADDAVVVRRLREAGAVIIGKTNMQEFGLGSTSVDSYFGPVRNPWNPAFHPGGSSGGSAVAVATGMCCAALGTDTGGSVRTPAAYCGIVGLKPTYNLISLDGIIPAKVSLDHCGILTRTAADCALVLEAITGKQCDWHQPVGHLSIGVPQAPFFDNLDPEVARLVEEAILSIERITAGVREVTLPPTSHISMAGETYDYHQPFFDSNPGRYLPHARKAIHKDSTARTVDYIRSRQELERLRETIDSVFDGFDAVVLPTRRRLPETIDEYRIADASEKPREPEIENTGPFNLYGIPAISVPCGMAVCGLPAGFLIAAPRFREDRVLALANAFEQTMGFCDA